MNAAQSTAMKTNAVIAAMLLLAVVPAASSSDAAWADREIATSSSLSAGSVAPVPVMTCTSGIGAVTFNWTAPTGGLARSGYRWTVTGAFTASGTLAANATSVQLTSGLLGIGTGTFSLYAVHASGWESAPKSGTVSFLTALLSNCSVL